MEEPRAWALAQEAQRLADGAGVVLPDGLQLWIQASGRPPADPAGGADPTAAAWALVAALERALDAADRQRGAHYTPAGLAGDVAGAARVGRAAGPVVDPACGGGALLLAAADRLVAAGVAREVVARGLLFGADIDPLAVAVAEVAIALWSGGVAPGHGHLVVADALRAGRGAWPDGPGGGFAAVVGNPPFQGQLAAATARDAASRGALRDRFGPSVVGYTDTAALFLLVGVELAAAGGRVAMVQPRSTAAARDAGPVRAALASRAQLVDLLVPEGRPFAANVHVCVPVLEVGRPGDVGEAPWTAHLARAAGVPSVELARANGVVGDRAEVVAGFRRHYYGLVGHVAEGGRQEGGHPLVTSGLVDLGRCAWGARPVRFARARWARPVVDVAGVRAQHPALVGWLDTVLRPKVVVATQTRVVEAAADRAGTWIPSTPVIAVVPQDPTDVDRLVAALCGPPVAAWAAGQAAGTGLSPGAVRLSAALVRSVPLPPDGDAWEAAAAALAAGDLTRFADAATAMHALPPATATAVRRWWEDASGSVPHPSA